MSSPKDAIVAAAQAAIEAQGPALPFDATVGVLAATLPAIPLPVAVPLVGPESVDARALPLLSVADLDADQSDLTLGATLGQGGMGVVVLAKQRSLQREVALKRPHDGANPGVMSALLREAVYTGYLEHPSIVPVHALGRDTNGRPLMLMKKVEGSPLDAILARPDHPAWARAGGDRMALILEVGRRVCDALAFAHSRGIVHRDVKPANVMIGEFGEVYLLDWGIAMRKGEPQRADAICGTLAYMAPEMLTPAEAGMDERTDVYLVGATLHECFTGKPPHDKERLPDVLASITASTPPVYGSDVPDEIASVLVRAMSPDRERRFSSAAALGQGLAQAERNRAAAELARTGVARLSDLTRATASGGDRARAHAHFYECRFAFEQALCDWPGCAAARDGLGKALLQMATFEISERNLAAAEALLLELSEPPDALTASLESLREALAREGADRERLKLIEHDMDDAVATRERAWGVRFAAVVLMLTVVGVVTVRMLGLFELTPRLISLAMLPGSAVVFTVFYRFRASFFANRVNRQMGFTLVTAITLVGINRTVGVLAARQFSEIISIDEIILATVAAVSALTLRRLYYLPAAFFLAASIASPWLGDRAFLGMICAAGASVTSVLLAPRGLRAPALDRPGDRKQAP